MKKTHPVRFLTKHALMFAEEDCCIHEFHVKMNNRLVSGLGKIVITIYCLKLFFSFYCR